MSTRLLATLEALACALALFCGHAGGARADSLPTFHLQLQSERAETASLLASASEDLPLSVHTAMLSKLLINLRDGMGTFLDDYTAPVSAGGGDGGGSGGLAFIAGLLGFFPGFGLGHLISGHIGGFALFLVIDLVIAGVFFVIFPLIAFNLWYLPGIIVIIVERVVEAFSAANAATSSPGYSDAAPAGSDGRSVATAALKLPVFNF